MFHSAMEQPHGRRVGTEAQGWMCPGAMDNIFAANAPIVVLNEWGDLPGFLNNITQAEIDGARLFWLTILQALCDILNNSSQYVVRFVFRGLFA